MEPNGIQEVARSIRVSSTNQIKLFSVVRGEYLQPVNFCQGGHQCHAFATHSEGSGGRQTRDEYPRSFQQSPEAGSTLFAHVSA